MGPVTGARRTAPRGRHIAPPAPPEATEAPETTAAPNPDPDPGDGQNPKRWFALIVCLVVVFMTLLDVSIVNVALPSLEQGLGASAAQLQWVLSGYAVTFGLALVPSGRLGDAFSRRVVLVIGLSGFTLASLACGLAGDPTVLVVARLIQGLFAGSVTPQVTGIVQDLFRGPERGRAFGYFGAVAGISTAVGPLLGGALIAAFGNDSGWRYVFFVNLPIGLVAVPLTWRILKVVEASAPARQRAPGRPQLDPVGSILLGLTVVSLLLPLVQQREWSIGLRLPFYGAAVVGLVAFLLWERAVLRRGGVAVIDLRLFRLGTYSFGSAIALIYFGAFTSVFFVLTLYLQQGQGYEAWRAGLTVTAFALLSIPGSRLSGTVSATHPLRAVRVGSPLVAVGLGLTVGAVRLGNGFDVGWWLVLPLGIAGFGSGLVLPANQTRAVSEIPVGQASSAGGAYQTFQRIGTAIGIALVGTVFFSGVSAALPGSAAPAGGGTPSGTPPPAIVSDAFASGYEHGILVSAGLAVATLLLALSEGLVHRRRRPGQTPAGDNPAGPPADR